MGGTSPIGSRRRRLLNQSTHSSVANSTASMFRQGPRRRITSVLYNPMIDSARALSYESPVLPNRGLDPAFGQSLAIADRQILGSPIVVVHQPVKIRAGVQRLLERIEHQGRFDRAGYAPAHDNARKHIDHEGDEDNAS
jgi:hypothetical protein